MSKSTHTSLEKRFKMRPAGVVSKKDMGLRKIAIAIFWCKILAACRQMVLVFKLDRTGCTQTSTAQRSHRINDCAMVRAALPNPNAKYIPIYLPTCALLLFLELLSDHSLSHTLPAVKMLACHHVNSFSL